MGGYGVDGRGTPTGDDGWGGGCGDALSYGCVVARRARESPREEAREEDEIELGWDRADEDRWKARLWGDGFARDD